MTVRQVSGQIGRREEPMAPPAAELPPVEELLDVDREYREHAAAGTLFRIAPRRMNPRHESWLRARMKGAEDGDQRKTA